VTVFHTQYNSLNVCGKLTPVGIMVCMCMHASLCVYLFYDNRSRSEVPHLRTELNAMLVILGKNANHVLKTY